MTTTKGHFMIHKVLAAMLLASSAAYAATYLNGVPTPLTVTMDGKDIYVATDGTVPPPIEPPIPPEPEDPAAGCPTEGRVKVYNRTLDLRAPGPQEEVTSTGITAQYVIGSDKAWHIAYGARPGSAGFFKWAGVFTCPIFDQAYLVGECAGGGSSSLAIKSVKCEAQMKAGEKYFLLYGADNCTDSTCRAVRNVYINTGE